ncbi:stage V sporulation protein SpoVM [Sporosarcina sp. Marseille-Q4063]|uniref:stage V sporulation protein SpoVM n=1 Tax=Sporosarcina sp. Marseille-Q4063 TaxID=2810514 RepID=UPI0020165013|nr:stage V sporulation protein SpoVM [Sporosarcina sp. Marseille-Q4063]
MLERSGELRVYTFTLPKFVSGFVRKCIVIFRKDEKSKPSPSNKKKRKKNEKMPG